MFEIFHRIRKAHELIRSGAVAGGRLTWERKPLPDAGAMQYAFETYGTPVYDFVLGNGAAVIRRPLVETQPAQWARFTAPIISNPVNNMTTGQFATQPLMDPNTAENLSISAPGAIPSDAYNSLAPQGLVLNP